MLAFSVLIRIYVQNQQNILINNYCLQNRMELIEGRK